MTHPGRAVDHQSASSCAACVDCIAWLLVHSEVVIVKQKKCLKITQSLRKSKNIYKKAYALWILCCVRHSRSKRHAYDPSLRELRESQRAASRKR